MGRATAGLLAERGFAVGLVDVKAADLQKVAEELHSQRHDVHAVAMDVSDRRAVEACVVEIQRELGPVWALAAAAGAAKAGYALEAPDGHFEALMNVNYFGVVWFDVACARAMIDSGAGGRIVNWSSVGALGGASIESAYCASKAAVDSFTRSFALELAPHAITVNSLRPGFIRTGMSDYFTDEMLEDSRQKVPLKRWGTPEEVAHLAAFLMSDEASFLTGTHLVADGGWATQMGRLTTSSARDRLTREQEYRRATGDGSS